MAAAVSLCLAAAVLAGCGHASPATKGDAGMENMRDMGDMPGMGQSSAVGVAAADPADNGLHGSVGGYAYAADTTTLPAGTPATFTFHITGPGGKTVSRFQPYEGQLLVFYLVGTDLGSFHRLTASMRDDGTWSVRTPALASGSYRTYITFAAPDSSAGTPLSYSLSQPLTVPGAAAVAAPPAGANTTTAATAATTATVDGYTLQLTGVPHQGTESELGVVVTRNGQPVQQFDRILDGYAHLAAVHSGDAAFVRALSTGRSAGGAGGAGALTARILLPESGTWRLFVQFQTAGAEHTAAFTVNVP